MPDTYGAAKLVPLAYSAAPLRLRTGILAPGAHTCGASRPKSGFWWWWKQGWGQGGPEVKDAL